MDAIHLNQLVQHHYRDQDETGIVTCYFRDGSILRSAKCIYEKKESEMIRALWQRLLMLV